MNAHNKEAEFFHHIAPKVRELVLSFKGNAAISVQKRPGDYATEVDIAVENLIVEEIERRFPGDIIMAEEGYADVQVPDGRIWIIDPICGTTNVGRGLKNFCTNIALADKRTLIASCVVDHSQSDYFWSVGEQRVYINDALLSIAEPVEGMGVVIDVDMGSLDNVNTAEKERFSTFLHRLVTTTDYMPFSLNTSLGFAYSAIGKFDGFVNIYNHPWDICASIFLMQQVGGVTTDLEGNPWTIEANNAIAARDPAVHKQLLDAYNGR